MTKIERYMQIPREQWKEYIVYHTSEIFGIAEIRVTAPNKTIARMIALGTLNAGIKIIKIEEV